MAGMNLIELDAVALSPERQLRALHLRKGQLLERYKHAQLQGTPHEISALACELMDLAEEYDELTDSVHTTMFADFDEPPLH